MITQNKPEGWNRRNVRYEEIHKVSSENLALVAESLNLAEGHVYLDLMCGYGAVAKAVLKYCASKGISIEPILADFTKEQLNRSFVELPIEIPRMLEDARSLSLADNSVDRISLKMGLHEVPRKDQYKVLKEAFRVLKPNGIIVIWDLMFKSKVEQLAFQAIIHEKNRLAGYNDMALNRYLPREEEIREFLTKANFDNIELIKEVPYSFSSIGRLHTEFNGDEAKLAEWNEFIRAVTPAEILDSIQFKDNGNTIEAVFRKGILRAVKPHLSDKGGGK